MEPMVSSVTTRSTSSPSTLFDKLWDQHVVDDFGGQFQLLYIDRHLVHDLAGPRSMLDLQRRGLPVSRPDQTFAVADHCVSSEPGRTTATTKSGARLLPVLRERCEAERIELFDLGDPEQGIVHVIGPELGLTLPGASIVCGDSHTCTHGAFGALAWGIGNSELTHVLATQCVIEQKPKSMRVTVDGLLQVGVSAKDLALRLLSVHGTDCGVGHAVEYAGSAISALDMDGRMTVCNLSIELGAKIGLIAPDETTFDYVEGRRYAPTGAAWAAAVASWRTLRSDEEATFDTEIQLDAADVRPQVSWGTTPAQAVAITGFVPDPAEAPDRSTAEQWSAALDYMGLDAGVAIEGTPIDRAFIGSCTNARLSDLVAAAKVVQGRSVAAGVEAWVVPGSMEVKIAAERLGLDDTFRAAGFRWREPSCSMCVATNGEYVLPGQRCISTSNRNFVGRQGPGARTHLASPATAAASAVAGHITADPAAS